MTEKSTSMRPLIEMWRRGIEKMKARLEADPSDKTAAFFLRAYEGYIKTHTKGGADEKND
jgi:hypothetical protein